MWGPIYSHNIKSNNYGFSLEKQLILNFQHGNEDCGGFVVETLHFLLSGLSETNQQILFVPIFSKQPLEILFATLIFR